MMSLGWLGRFTEAAAYEAEIIRLAQAAGHANTIGWAQCAAGTLHMLRGDRAKARGPFETFLAEVRTGNVGVMLPPAMAFSAWRLAQFGETAEALERLRVTEQLLLEQAARGWIGQTGWLWGLLGRAAFVLGRPDEARRLAGRAIDCSPHQPGFAAYALLLQGDIAASSQGFDAERGETCYRAALALAEPRGMRPLIARCHLGLGRLHRRLGRRGQADRFLETVMAMHRGMEMSLEDSRQDETMGVP